MKYLVLLLALFMVSNVNAENIKDLHQKWWDMVRNSKSNSSNICLRPNIYGEVDYTNQYCFYTYYELLRVPDIEPFSTKNYLDRIRLKKHICADLLATYKRTETDYHIESYKYFCTNLENDQRTYEYYKNDCMKNDPDNKLVCFSYKFE